MEFRQRTTELIQIETKQSKQVRSAERLTIWWSGRVDRIRDAVVVGVVVAQIEFHIVGARTGVS